MRSVVLVLALALTPGTLCACASTRVAAVVSPASSPIVAMSSRRPADPGVLADSIHLRCDDARCPEGVGMLIWRGEADEGLQRCTASLIGPDLALTASHCLPPAARHVGASCEGIWMTFADSERHPAEWAECQTILHASPDPEQTVMRTDLALLRLDHRVTREPLSLAYVPNGPATVVSVVAVRPHPIYPNQHELSTRLCRVATPESAVESFGAEAAQVGWLIECPSHPGNSGSPILDHRGRIRGVLHGGSGPVDRIAITSRLGELPALSAAASND